MALTMALS